MGTKAGRKQATHTTDMPQDLFPVFDARTRLVSSISSMGWRMAIMIIIPIIIGLKLDERFETKPSYVLTGFFLAIGGCAYIIYSEYKEINAEMAELYDKPTKRRVTSRSKRKKEA
jgi:hypothetical protein